MELLQGLPGFEIRATQPSQLRDEMANGLQQLRTLFGAPTDASLENPDFDVLHPDCCRVVVLDKSWNTWEQALSEVGEKFQAFRSRRQPDYRIVKDAINKRTGSLSPVRRAAFGLPIVFYYRSLGGQHGVLEGEDHDRRASPLLLRLVRLANPRFVVVLTVFKSELLDEGYDERLKLKLSGSAPIIGAPPDLSIIDEFIAELTTRNSNHFVAPGLEVSYR
jgi:CRISPR-associated protein Cmr1